MTETLTSKISEEQRSKLSLFRINLIRNFEYPPCTLEEALEYDESCPSGDMIRQYVNYFNPLRDLDKQLRSDTKRTLDKWWDMGKSRVSLTKERVHESVFEGDFLPMNKFLRDRDGMESIENMLISYVPFSWIYHYFNLKLKEGGSTEHVNLTNYSPREFKDSGLKSVKQSKSKTKQEEKSIKYCTRKLVRHKLPILEDDNQKYNKFYPNSNLKSMHAKVEYDSTKSYTPGHNGQLKLLMAFIQMLNMNNTGGRRVLFYGSAPGFAIMKLTELLGLEVVAVDDYPTYYSKNATYVSFEDFFNKSEEDMSFDYAFFDSHSKEDSRHDHYSHMLEVLSRFENVAYSIKRFIPINGTMEKFLSSRISPLVYSSSETLEVRELGVKGLLNDEIVRVKGILNSYRHYLQYDRHAVKYGNSYIKCGCYDCSYSDHQVISLFLRNVCLGKLQFLKLFLEVQKGVYSSRQASIYNSVLSTEKFNDLGGGMVTNGEYVWKKDFLKDFEFKILPERYLNDGRYVRGQPVNFDPGWPHRLIVARFHKMPSLAIFKKTDVSKGRGDDLLKFTLPLVKIRSKGKANVNFTPAGDYSKTYQVDEVLFEPPCPVCGYAERDMKVSLRDYLACYRPDSYTCTKCLADYELHYYALEH
jgi:hypothetical protein